MLSVACGHATRQASAPEESAQSLDDTAPAPEPGAQPPTDELERDTDGSAELELEEFERARLELSEILGRDIGESVALESSAPREESARSRGGAAPTRSPAPAAADKAAEAAPAKPKASKKGDDACGLVCRAFGSLVRSAAAVCRLDGQTERCRRASSVVDVAEADPGVKTCGCKR